jgi:phosphoribosylaminoimidazolecarboxamide formyltransferase/IMP cyclohydrolase
MRSNPEHVAKMKEHGIENIDMVVVNLYPFEATVAKDGCTLEDAIENIDIGGPTMLRSAAKNWPDVTVITDPADYEKVLLEMTSSNGTVSRETNFGLAVKVYQRTAAYDAAISNWLGRRTGDDVALFPDTYTVQFRKAQEMRYGENPHQNAAFYVETASPRHQPQPRPAAGKELPTTTLLIRCGPRMREQFSDAPPASLSHANPGVAVGDSPDAYDRAYRTDPESPSAALRLQPELTRNSCAIVERQSSK